MFTLILGVVALALASCAAFFSVYGLASTFSGAFLAVIAMGASIEAGKLVAASALYRFWDIMPKWLRSFLIPAVVGGMIVTSFGIFGFLSAAYQQDTLIYKQNDAEITLLKTEQQQLLTRKKQIDEQIAQLPDNYVTSRQRLIRSFKPETDHINKRLPEISKELLSLTKEQIKTSAHVGPIIYIAKVLGQDVDDATKWLIFLIIFIFDPMAIALTLTINIAMVERQKKKAAEGPKTIEVIKEVPVEVIKEVEKIVEKEVPVEIEKIVEKIVEKEVPVEKVVEVPAKKSQAKIINGPQSVRAGVKPDEDQPRPQLARQDISDDEQLLFDQYVLLCRKPYLTVAEHSERSKLYQILAKKGLINAK